MKTHVILGTVTGMAAGIAIALLWRLDDLRHDAYAQGLRAGRKARRRREQEVAYKQGYRTGLGRKRCTGREAYRVSV